MTTQAERHKAAELARLRRQLESPVSTDFEREDAARRIGLLTDGPTCAHCEKLFSTHGDALCPVLARWQRKQGRGSIPSPGQAADVRKAIADDEAARQRAAAKRAAKNSQGNLF